MVLQLVVFLSLGKDAEWQRVRPGHLGVPKWKYVLTGRVGWGCVCVCLTMFGCTRLTAITKKGFAELVDDLMI